MNLKTLSLDSVRHRTSVYTMRLPWSRLYIISSPNLVAAVDRHSRTLSLVPLALDFIKRITVPSKQGLETLEKNFRVEKGARNFHTDIVRAMSTALAPGIDLEHTTAEMVTSAVEFLDLTVAPSKSKKIDLFLWTRDLLTQASTDALYGAGSNPFQDASVGAALW